MTVRQPPRPGFVNAALAAFSKLWARVQALLQKRGPAPTLPGPAVRPVSRAATDFTSEPPKRAPVSLGESPTSAAEKPREGAGVVKHVGEQAVVGSQRARQLLLDVQHKPPVADRPRKVDADAPKAKIPPGPFRP